MGNLRSLLCWLLVAAVSAFAETAAAGSAVDYSILTEAIDFSTVSAGVLGAAAALISVYVIIKGVRLVMGFVRGDGASGGGSGGGGWSDWMDGGEGDGSEFRRRRNDSGGWSYEHRGGSSAPALHEKDLR